MKNGYTMYGIRYPREGAPAENRNSFKTAYITSRPLDLSQVGEGEVRVGGELVSPLSWEEDRLEPH